VPEYPDATTNVSSFAPTPPRDFHIRNMPKATFEYERPNYRHQTYNATTICSSDQIVPESTLLPLNPQGAPTLDHNLSEY